MCCSNGGVTTAQGQIARCSHEFITLHLCGSISRARPGHRRLTGVAAVCSTGKKTACRVGHCACSSGGLSSCSWALDARKAQRTGRHISCQSYLEARGREDCCCGASSHHTSPITSVESRGEGRGVEACGALDQSMMPVLHALSLGTHASCRAARYL